MCRISVGLSGTSPLRLRSLFNSARVLLRHYNELEVKNTTDLIKHPDVIPLTNIKLRSDKDSEATTKSRMLGSNVSEVRATLPFNSPRYNCHYF